MELCSHFTCQNFPFNNFCLVIVRRKLRQFPGIKLHFISYYHRGRLFIAVIKHRFFGHLITQNVTKSGLNIQFCPMCMVMSYIEFQTVRKEIRSYNYFYFVNVKGFIFAKVSGPPNYAGCLLKHFSGSVWGKWLDVTEATKHQTHPSGHMVPHLLPFFYSPPNGKTYCT